MKAYNLTTKIKEWIIEKNVKVVIKNVIVDILVFVLVWSVALPIIVFLLYHQNYFYPLVEAINNFKEWQYNFHPYKYKGGFFVSEEEKNRWEIAICQFNFIMWSVLHLPLKIFVFSIIMSVFWTISAIMFWIIWFIIRIGPVINAMIGDGIYRAMKIRRIRKKKEALHRRMPNIFGKELGALSSVLKRGRTRKIRF